jgi:hypothetical protein
MAYNQDNQCLLECLICSICDAQGGILPMAAYAEVISPNPSKSAKRYAQRLPYVIIAPAIGGVAIILFFFFLPWFSTGLPATLASAANLHGPTNVSAITLGTSTLHFSQVVTANDASGTFNVSDSYSFPLIWAIPVMGLIQIALALFLLQSRVLTRWLALAIRLSFVGALLFEVIYFVSSYFLSFGAIKGAGGQIATFPTSGLWFSLLVSIITAVFTFVIIPDLMWCWLLSVNDMARATRISELQASNARAV